MQRLTSHWPRVSCWELGAGWWVARGWLGGWATTTTALKYQPLPRKIVILIRAQMSPNTTTAAI